jgi:hypothetical protein
VAVVAKLQTFDVTVKLSPPNESSGNVFVEKLLGEHDIIGDPKRQISIATARELQRQGFTITIVPPSVKIVISASTAIFSWNGW